MKKVLVMPWILALILFCSTIKIKADTLQSTQWFTYYSDSNKQNEISNNGNYSAQNLIANQNNIQWLYFYLDKNITKTYGDYVLLQYLIIGETYNDNVSSNVIYECDEWEDYSSTTGTGYYCSSFNNSNSQIHITTPVNYHFNVLLKATDGAESHCQIIGNSAKCYIQEGKEYNQIRVQYNYSLSQSIGQLKLGFNKMLTMFTESTTTINNSINNQTQQQQQNYENMMNETRSYDSNINTNQNGANETMEWGQQEEALMNQLDMNTTMLSDININPTAAAFIWDIVGGLRNMNPAIVMLFTSLLGLGVARMLLNR